MINEWVILCLLPSNLRWMSSMFRNFPGCLWGVELAYQRMPGVLETAVGYTDGHKKDPTYQEVCSGTTGHTDALQIKYDKNIGEKHLIGGLFQKLTQHHIVIYSCK